MPPLSELGQAALAYAEQGVYVFPIVPGQKKPPLLKDYYTLSSRDPEQIAAWWTSVPEANIGVDCGKTGWTGIDADPRNGGTPILAGLKLLTGGKRAWATRVAKTPNGGEHYIFKAAPQEEGVVPHGTHAGNFGLPGVDVRDRGGYLVLPPSRTANGRYEWANDCPILPIPRKLLSPPGESRRGLDGKTEIERRLTSDERIVEGSRDTYLASFAGKLRDLGLRYEEIRAAVEASYRERCDPGEHPFTEQDFERIARSATRYEPRVDLPGAAAATAASEPTGHFNRHDDALSVSASNFLLGNPEPVEYLVEGIFPLASPNMLSGPPKAGKSTIMRHLALCAAYGIPFLGQFATKPTRVLYYSLQENKPHLRAWLLEALWGAGVCKKGEVPQDVPIDFIWRLGNRGHKAIKGTFERIQEREYGLVLIDMYGTYSAISHVEDYSENQAITDALNEVSQRTKACIIWAHHERKSGGGADPFSGAIGSQAIRGSVYTTMLHRKDHGRFYVATEQRYGDDLPMTCVTLDKTTQKMRAVGTGLRIALADDIARERKVREILERDPEMGISEIRAAVGGRTREVAALVDRIRPTLSPSVSEETA